MSNVVDLPLGVRVSPLLEKVADLGKIGLGRLLSSFFDNIDDALFELADRSRSDTDQQIYFESMRELRLARPNVERAFLDELVAKTLALPEPPARRDARTEATVETMSLVRNDELEVTVAIAGIVSKITSRFSLAIAQLTRRLDALCPKHEIEERDNPLGPVQLCDCFVVATASVQLDIKVRIILLKLFERLVGEQMGPLYDDANRLLAEAGILRNMKDFPPRNRRPLPGAAARPPGHDRPDPAAAQGNASGHGQPGFHPGAGAPSHGQFHAGDGTYEGGPANGGDATFAMDILSALGLSPSLMAPLRSQPPLPGAHGGGAFQGMGGLPGMGGSSGMGGSPGTAQGSGMSGQTGAYQGGHPGAGPLPIYATSDLIGAVAHAQREHASAAFDLDHVPPAVDLRPLLLSALTAAKGNAGRITGPDEDVVNLVGMLFDYILNDRNLAIPMKALLGRLQIPYLKVALLDRRFFTQSSHPARQLLNELSSAGIGWSGSAELRRDAMYDLIESIVVRVLNRFEHDMQIFQTLLDELRGFRQHDDRRNKIVEQRIKDAESGRSKAQAARRAVARIIDQKAQGLELPVPVRDFIRDGWSKVLIFVSLRHGAAGREWQQTIENLDELLWCAQPLGTHHDLDERETLLPRLLTQLHDGLSLTGGDIALLRAVEVALASRADADRQRLRGAEVQEQIDLAPLDLDAEHAVVKDAEPEPTPDALALVDRLRPETWLEFRHADGPPTRAKLASVLDDGQRWLFVNRKGMKVFERTRNQLARELASAQATILEDRQLFDRALERIIRNLRSRDDAPAIDLGGTQGSTPGGTPGDTPA